MTDDERVDWEIKSIRKSIDLDWAMLASKDLSADKRRGFKEHLLINVSTLQDLVTRNRSASQKSKLERYQSLSKLNADGSV